MSAIHLSHVSFSYSSAVPVITDATFDLGPGWAGLVGANGVGKSTLLSLITGEHPPDDGTVSVEPVGLPPVLCAQRVDTLTVDIRNFGWDWDGDAVRMRAKLDLVPDQLERWPTLSPGERKRWQIGAALVARPDVLLLDEPTNHLDAAAHDLLLSALGDFRGCGVVVSHDRDLLNNLTTKTVRVLPGRVRMWNGSYDAARDAWIAETAEQVETLQRMKADRKKLARRLDEQHRKTAHQDAKRMRERRAAGKHDLDTRGSAASYKHERGQKTGAQTVSTMSNSLQKLDGDLEGASLAKDLGGGITFDFEPSNKEFLTRYDGPVLAGTEELFKVDVAMRRTDRIRIAGRNGAGKTSLLRLLVDEAAIPPDKILYLTQETTAAGATAWLDEVNSLPSSDRGRVMTLVARLGADPGALLQSHQPSPGEARKIALALGLGTAKWLLVLDEPTNHLDLPSIERLESALVAYEGALLLITHDDALADRTTDTTWTLGDSGLVM
ncbi:MAG: ATP-binding cassette domain-containing protein [Actinomycetia bacterium]|nr:ATP-binding cassette domain-containing protein [Actinomycetes bacterium]